MHVFLVLSLFACNVMMIHAVIFSVITPPPPVRRILEDASCTFLRQKPLRKREVWYSPNHPYYWRTSTKLYAIRTMAKIKFREGKEIVVGPFSEEI